MAGITGSIIYFNVVPIGRVGGLFALLMTCN